MKKNLFLLCVACCWLINSHAGMTKRVEKKYYFLKGNFYGKISDATTSQPIEGASIYLADVKIGATSNRNGEFFIPNIAEGNHLVEISHIGYTTIAENITITADTKKDFLLSKSIVENNAVIITGVTGATALKKIPFSVGILHKEDLAKTTSINIIESLTKISGVATLSTGPAVSKPIIRGLGYNRVLIIHDGVRQEGQQWGDEHGVEIDQASVNKIELLKGPASLIYGSDALAGVVNIITHTTIANNTLKGNISGNYQTNNKLRVLNFNMGGNKNGFNWNMYTSNRWAGDYKNKYDGYVFNSKFIEHNLGGYAGYNGNWGYSHLLLSYFNLRTGLVEGERDEEGYFTKSTAGGGKIRTIAADFKRVQPFIPFQHIQHFKITTDNSIKLGKSRLTLNAGFQRNRREEFGNPDDVRERALFFDLKTTTYTAQYHFAENKGWKMAIGINGMHQQNKNKGVEQLIPDYRLSDMGGYIYAQKTIRTTAVSGGIRYDTRNIETGDLMDGADVKAVAFAQSFSNISASLGLTTQLTKHLNIRFNIARGFRVPGIAELSSNGAHEGTIRYEYGNNHLQSETSLQSDGGFKLSSEHISLDVAAFYNYFNNFIFYRKLQAVNGGDSLVDVDGEYLTAFTFDQRRASLSGFEITFDIHPHPLDWLHIQNSFSFVKGKFKTAIEDAIHLPFIPAPKLVTEFRGDFDKIHPFIHNFYAKFELDNTFTQNNIFTAYNTETKTKGYTLLNAGIGADFLNKKQKTLFILNISLMNIGNIAYQNHLSRLKYTAENRATRRTGVFNMGRNCSIKLNVPLHFNWGS